jgi:hypothetical protein
MTALRERKQRPTRAYSKKLVGWIKSDWFCMECGKQDVWQEIDGGDDYYHARTVECHSCGHDMCCVGDVKDE